jgi:enoyl-CoA hydratase/carnithine racemase
MTENAVLYEERGAAAWLTINRPEALNSINEAVLDGLNDGLDRAEASAGLRAVVVTGTGRAFSAGADLKSVREQVAKGDDSFGKRFVASILAVLDRMERFPLPVIAAVNGMALAGGLETVLACDLVIAAESARLGDAHANYGLIPGGGGSVRLPRKVGPTRAKYLMFTGAFVPAAELVASGLVNEVVPDDQLVEAVEKLVEQLAGKSPLGLARMKQLVNDGLEQPQETAIRLEYLMSELHAKSDDMTEGLAAFEEKRQPNFTGR